MLYFKCLYAKTVVIPALFVLFIVAGINASAQTFIKGALLYENPLAKPEDIKGWKMEGPGTTGFEAGWMHLYSVGEKGHHVLWCPENFPSDFIAEWDAKNLNPKAGLCIVFFAAKGLHGEDIFDTTLPVRNGTFKGYTNGAINNYHISYYANARNEPGRETANLRKNKGFHKVEKGQRGIPLYSDSVYRVRLVKCQNHIQMFINDRKIIDWMDDGQHYGNPLTDGKIGFRQMKWTHFAYCNFKVWRAVAAK